MKKIKNVLLCGLGAIGTYYAHQISLSKNIKLNILADKKRIEKYTDTPRILNSKKLFFNYITPDTNKFKADLIIIAVKSYSLTDIIRDIENFVSNNTIILSLLNGVTSEDTIYKKYLKNKGIYSYVLGHTFFRENDRAKHDGVSKIHFGSTIPDDTRCCMLRKFFEESSIEYEEHSDIIRSMWEKFVFNCCVNQISAVTGFTFKEIEKSKLCINMMDNITNEIALIAKAKKINGYENFYHEVLKSLKLMCPDGKTSMLQDVESGRKTEVDIFGKTVTRLGKLYNIETPYNKILSEIIELL